MDRIFNEEDQRGMASAAASVDPLDIGFESAVALFFARSNRMRLRERNAASRARVMGGTGRTVLGNATLAQAEEYAELHPAFRVEIDPA